jgi:tetratricopeptide (TPR) repeat protein
VRSVDWKAKLSWGEDELYDLRMLAYGYLREGHYQKAVTIFEALLVVQNDCVYDQQTLGALYLQMGDAVQAIGQLRRALELKENHLPTLLNLSKALLVQGEIEEGLTLARRLMRGRNRRIADTAEALTMAYSTRARDSSP